MKRLFFIAATLVSTQAAAAEIYKCVDSSGKQSFSQRPCSAAAQKITVNGPAAAGFVAPDSKAIDALEGSNRMRAIEREIRQRERNIDGLNNDMTAEIDRLERDSLRANNNLAGATWQQALATKMQAVTQKYNAQISIEKAAIDRLKEEQSRLLEGGNG